MFTGIALAIGGYFLGDLAIGHAISNGIDAQNVTDQNDIAFTLGLVFAAIGFLVGLGFLAYPAARLRGASPSLREKEEHGIWRYFTLCTDHKVVGIQYLWGVLFFFLIAGLNAMLMRTQLLYPTEHFTSADNYITLVSLHGTMMLMMTTSMILGPFGNYFTPILIGAKRMAFPRIESLSFWLLPAAEVVLLGAIGAKGIPTGWTGYPTLADQARLGMDCYLVSFALIGLSMVLVGFNMLATVYTMR